jgi:GntR family transcriptional regulator, transcriptional repressor for pyruvate dehydrogenase complex
VYNPIHISCVYEEVSSQIQSLISNGSLRPGDRLPSERELAGKFKVSRESIREALKKLHQIGLVETRSHRGTFVSAPKNASDGSRTFGVSSTYHSNG